MHQRTRKIAIVDDAPFIREVLRNIAKTQGWYIVGEAEDGLEAIAMVTACKPQVIIMDLVMPNLNGIEATQKILNQYPQMKIIACSTMDQENVLLKAIEIGCCSFITKPFQKDEVIRVVNQAFELIKEVS